MLNLITHWPFEEKHCVNENKTMKTGKSFSCKFLSVNFSYTTAYVERILCAIDVLHEIVFEQTSKIYAYSDSEKSAIF